MKFSSFYEFKKEYLVAAAIIWGNTVYGSTSILKVYDWILFTDRILLWIESRLFSLGGKSDLLYHNDLFLFHT